jgi:hypothetical protein
MIFGNMASSWLRCYVQPIALVFFVYLSVCCNAASYSSNSSFHGDSLYLPSRVPQTLAGRTIIPDQMLEAAADPSLLVSRGISQDPSCPAGFLCLLEACPSDVVCQPGDTCINFEGTIACSSSSLQWCALNPSTFEAVGCNNGQCW